MSEAKSHHRKVQLLPITGTPNKPPQTKPELKWLSLDSLVIDDRYQRSIETRGIKTITKIVHNFCWTQFSPIFCADLGDDTYAIIDGQHRAHAAMAVGVTMVPCIISKMDLDDQAKAFVGINSNITAVTSFQILKAALQAEEPWALELRKVVEEAGCRLMTSNYSAADKQMGMIFGHKHLQAVQKQKKLPLMKMILKGIMASGVDDWHYLNNMNMTSTYSAFTQFKNVTQEELDKFFAENDLLELMDAVHHMKSQPAYRHKQTKMLFTALLVTVFRTKIRGEANDQ